MRDDLVEPLTVSPGDSPTLVSAPVPGLRTSRAALVTEALGYLGGVIILVGVSLLPDAGALPGLAVWGVSVAWLALAWGGLLPGRQVGTVLGAVGMVGAAATLGGPGLGGHLGVGNGQRSDQSRPGLP
jgi:hypothetical protein